MKVKLSRSDFKDFLNPIVRISEGGNSTCALHIEKGLIYTITHTPDLVCIYYAKIFPIAIEDFDKPTTIYIADVRKILTALSAIDEEEVTIKIDDKCISYTSDTVKFKCYLLDSAVASAQKINASRLDELSYDCEFIIDEAAFARITKGCVFTENTGKIYFYTKDDKVFVDIDDKAAQYSVNNITFIASNDWMGLEINPTSPLTIESFKIISAAKNSVKTSVNITKGVYMFYNKVDNIEFKYFLRALKS
jgi:hypothetical protein